MYMRNRYYDPATGQFTQTDPIGLAGGLNAFGFAAGDPITYSDPYGLCPPIESCGVFSRISQRVVLNKGDQIQRGQTTITATKRTTITVGVLRTGENVVLLEGALRVQDSQAGLEVGDRVADRVGGNPGEWLGEIAGGFVKAGLSTMRVNFGAFNQDTGEYQVFATRGLVTAEARGNAYNGSNPTFEICLFPVHCVSFGGSR
jgi:uncharacterized protein RhaS with RHS repeats